MKKIVLAVFLIALYFSGRVALAKDPDPEGVLPVAQKMVAEDKRRFGIDVKKCRLECERIYSHEHCVQKCAEMSKEQKNEAFTREVEEKAEKRKQDLITYKDVVEKYR